MQPSAGRSSGVRPTTHAAREAPLPKSSSGARHRDRQSVTGGQAPELCSCQHSPNASAASLCASRWACPSERAISSLMMAACQSPAQHRRQSVALPGRGALRLRGVRPRAGFRAQLSLRRLFCCNEIIEVMVQLGPILSDRLYPLQQLVSRSFEERSADLNMEVLAQRHGFGPIA